MMFRNGSLLAIGFSLLAGCSSAESGAVDENGKTPEHVGQASEALVANLPQCNPQYPNHTNGTTVRAIPRTDGSYWKSFPDSSIADPSIQAYAQRLWSIARTNGYEYEVQVVVNQNGQWTPVTSRFYLVGIRDSNASPPYLMTPPAPGAVRWPYAGGLFSPTSTDFTSEENLTRSYYGVSPVLADSYACVTVIDAYGNPIDYFPLAGTHDPSGQPW